MARGSLSGIPRASTPEPCRVCTCTSDRRARRHCHHQEITNNRIVSKVRQGQSLKGNCTGVPACADPDKCTGSGTQIHLTSSYGAQTHMPTWQTHAYTSPPARSPYTQAHDCGSVLQGSVNSWPQGGWSLQAEVCHLRETPF